MAETEWEKQDPRYTFLYGWYTLLRSAGDEACR